jgi:type II secretory pathway component GspD/PulD (secretin)
VIGFFFGKNTRKNDRRELVLFLTPHIITDEIQSKTVTDELKKKITGLQEDFEKERKRKEKKSRGPLTFILPPWLGRGQGGGCNNFPSQHC